MMDNNNVADKTKNDDESKEKSEMMSITNQEARMKCQLQDLKMKIAELKLMEPGLRHRIERLKQKDNEMKAMFEKLSREVEDVRTAKKVIDLKVKNHRLKSSHYKRAMKDFKREIPNFLIVDEYIRNDRLDQEISDLKTELDSLQNTYKKILENRTFKEEDVRNYVQKNPSEKMLNLMRNIRTLEMNIEMRKKELQQVDN